MRGTVAKRIRSLAKRMPLPKVRVGGGESFEPNTPEYKDVAKKMVLNGLKKSYYIAKSKGEFKKKR